MVSLVRWGNTPWDSHLTEVTVSIMRETDSHFLILLEPTFVRKNGLWCIFRTLHG